MIDEGGPKTIEQEAREFVGRRGIPGDLTNNLGVLKGDLLHPEDWPQIEPALTYEQFFRVYKPRHAEAVIAASNKELVAGYNALVLQINQEIEASVTSVEQAARIRSFIDQCQKIISGEDRELEQ